MEPAHVSGFPQAKFHMTKYLILHNIVRFLEFQVHTI